MKIKKKNQIRISKRTIKKKNLKKKNLKSHLPNASTAFLLSCTRTAMRAATGPWPKISLVSLSHAILATRRPMRRPGMSSCGGWTLQYSTAQKQKKAERQSQTSQCRSEARTRSRCDSDCTRWPRPSRSPTAPPPAPPDPPRQQEKCAPGRVQHKCHLQGFVS